MFVSLAVRTVWVTSICVGKEAIDRVQKVIELSSTAIPPLALLAFVQIEIAKTGC